MKTITASILALGLFAASAEAGTMSFEGLPATFPPSLATPVLSSHTEDGLTMQATSQPDCVPFGPYVYDAGDHKGIHYDGMILSFSMNGNPFDLIAINFDKVAYASESHMFVTTNNGFEVEIPTTDSDFTYTFDPASFQAITSFTITPEHKFSCVELDWIQFRTPQTPDPVPEPSTFMLLGAGLGGFALWRRRAKR